MSYSELLIAAISHYR